MLDRISYVYDIFSLINKKGMDYAIINRCSF